MINYYINAPIKEKVWTNLGPEYGNDTGKRAIIVRALYGLKSAGADFCSHLGYCMQGLGYEPCLAEPYLWTKAEVRPDNNYKH